MPRVKEMAVKAANNLEEIINKGKGLMGRKMLIRSKNDTAKVLRGVIPSKGKWIVFRLGSTTPNEEIIRGLKGWKKGDVLHEINTVEACKVSGDKKAMKEAFDELNVTTAEWYWMGDQEDWVWEKDMFPSIIKHRHSSKGNGIFYINNEEELCKFEDEHARDLSSYIIEKYYDYPKEYRLHVDKDGCFYTCRKMLKKDAEEKWHRHDENCVWFLEENPNFNKPMNWDKIVEECIHAKDAVGLDIAACDVKVDWDKNGANFIILETNSAPSLGEITAIKYIDRLKQIADEI